MANLERSELHYGDNLKVLREKIPDEIADLIYLDPPFNSARNYNLLFKQVKGDPSPAQIMAFEDTWTWSPHLYDEFREEERNARLFPLIAALYDVLGPSEMMAYVLMMAPRLLELHRKLKPTGSLYLHCDPAASHYLKVILDAVFNARSFRNEIVWKRTTAHGGANRWGRVHDTVLCYAKGPKWTWNPLKLPHEEKYLASKYRYDDDGGRYRLDNLTGAGMTEGDSCRPWRGFEPAKLGRHWAAPTDPLEDLFGGAVKQMSTIEKLDLLYEHGYIYIGKARGGGDGFPQYKRYLKGGTTAQDVITDIPPINSQAKERRGYPTQKPLALLERIIAASSNEGDVVVDPFAGCGTAIVAAERMGRKWIGIDVTYLAISEVKARLEEERVECKPLDYKEIGTPADALGAAKLFEETANRNHKPFEQFCVGLVHGQWREKQGADRGIDGVIHLWDQAGKLRNALIQVKGGNALTLSAVRDFASVINDNNAILGLMISMREPTKEMMLVCEQQGYADWATEKRYPKMQIRTVKDLLEQPRNPFEIPDSWRVRRSEGVGKQAVEQVELELGE